MKEDKSAYLKIDETEDDGLYTPVIKEHSLDKYRVINLLLNIFSTGMKNRWDERVCIDLFSGAGKSKLEDSEKIYPGSPWLSLTTRDPFSKYIFCELGSEESTALKLRLAKFFPSVNYSFIEGDVNENVATIKDLIPTGSKQNKVLTLCLADPFNIESLKFKTIENLNNGYMDFFILIPSFMDVRRNQALYLDHEDSSISTFLGDESWRDKWVLEKAKGVKMGLFILDQFGQRMKSLGFLYEGPEKALTISITSKNVPLYHLCLFSKHKRGIEFWDETRKYFSDQLRLL